MKVLSDSVLHSPLLNLAVTLSHCPLIGLARWAEGYDMLWKVGRFLWPALDIVLFQGPGSLKVKEWKK